MRIALLQVNTTPGDFSGNIAVIAGQARKALTASGQPLLCIVPAGALAGFPWEGLTRREGFYSLCHEAGHRLAEILLEGPDLLMGLPSENGIYYVLLKDGRMGLVPRTPAGMLRIRGRSIYVPEDDWTRAAQAMSGYVADAVLDMTPRRFVTEGQAEYETECAHISRLWNRPVLSVRLWGATDGLVLSGGSCVFSPSGEITARAPLFEDAILSFDLDQPDDTGSLVPIPGREECLFRACVTGIRDYARKCRLSRAVLGLSGGMDSAMVACMAVKALGAGQVLAVLMPSPWSSDHSLADAKLLSRHLGITACTIPIQTMMDAFSSALALPQRDIPSAAPEAEDMVMENIQPRIRGTLLMAFANHAGAFVLGTGNKSENAVGYCTLYGDTVGAIEPIGDIYKTELYAVARWYNQSEGRGIIPENIFAKAPSAELRPDQKDEDSLPPYEILDAILRQLFEERRSPENIHVPGCDKATLHSVLRKIETAEFKRHQTPPPLRLSSCTMGYEWRMPASAKILLP
ncbi:MAG: NAD(+) synthase [Desulfovibrionaceae bacterium]|nr:MAG: NAD(+) synthase [Desulfovibrionaceae bacterium]